MSLRSMIIGSEQVDAAAEPEVEGVAMPLVSLVTFPFFLIY